MTVNRVDQGEVRILTYYAGVNSPVYVQVVHVPTGIVTEGRGPTFIQARSNATARLSIALIVRKNKEIK